MLGFWPQYARNICTATPWRILLRTVPNMSWTAKYRTSKYYGIQHHSSNVNWNERNNVSLIKRIMSVINIYIIISRDLGLEICSGRNR